MQLPPMSVQMLHQRHNCIDKRDEISRGFHLNNNKNCYYPSKQEADVKTCCGVINDPAQ
jgi:hypothetical protein